MARAFYDRDHSAGPAQDHEDIPAWVRAFFPVFEAQANQAAHNQRAADVRDERNQIAASLIGRQAPLGARGNDGPVQLRNELARNAGSRALRQQVIGDVDAERVGVEGRDDAGRVQRAPRRRTGTGTRRRNVHIPGFGADENDPSARFAHIRASYESMSRLSDAISHSFAAPEPPRLLIETVRNYAEVAGLRDAASSAQDTSFYERAAGALDEELDRAIDRARPMEVDEGEGGDEGEGEGEEGGRGDEGGE